MYRQQVYTEQTDSLLHVISADRHVGGLVGKSASPFRELSSLRKFYIAAARRAVYIAERIIGTKLYVTNDFRELAALDPRARALLTKLLRNGTIDRWQCSQMNPDAPPVHSCRLDLAKISLPNGKEIAMGGATGHGTGESLQAAMIASLGELLERHSQSTWDRADMVRGSYATLRQRGAIHPSVFQFYSDEQLQHASFHRGRADEETMMDWMPAYDLLVGSRVLVPSTLVYMFYAFSYPEEPEFWVSTSNGVAAGSSLHMAAYRALCEAIERDAFMIHWLNMIAPPKIKLDSVPHPEICKLREQIKDYNVEFHLLDLTTDISVPTLSALAIDHDHGTLRVSAVTDFDVNHALSKIARETRAFLHSSRTAKRDASLRGEDIKSIDDRWRYWAQQGRFEHALFLTQGPEKDFDKIPKTKHIAFTEALERVVSRLRDKGYHIYIAECTAPLAKDAGLRVVKAIVPELMPIYFNESKQYLGVKRLFTVPAELGYPQSSNDEFNPVPHPFL